MYSELRFVLLLCYIQSDLIYPSLSNRSTVFGVLISHKTQGHRDILDFEKFDSALSMMVQSLKQRIDSSIPFYQGQCLM